MRTTDVCRGDLYIHTQFICLLLYIDFLLFNLYFKIMNPLSSEVPVPSGSQEGDVVVLQEISTQHTERSSSRSSHRDLKSNHSHEGENDVIMLIENDHSLSKSRLSSLPANYTNSNVEPHINIWKTKDQENEAEEDLNGDGGESGEESCNFIVIDEVGAVDENSECNDEDEPRIIFSEDQTGLFCLDTNPEISKDKPLGPRFRREFDSTLSSDNDGKELEETRTNTQDNRCFNCLGDHTLSSCPNSRDQQAIARNRGAFLRNQPIRVNMNRRYHCDDSSKFEHLKPGIISDELRKALGLRRTEIPHHVYKMRILGYPPGWIEDIKQQSSGLDLIDHPNGLSSSEDSHTVSYDLERIISYPGFNVPLKRGYRDDWQYLNYPPMQLHHSKEVFIQNLRNCERGSRRHSAKSAKKRVHSQEESDSSITTLDVIDMDTSVEDLEKTRQILLAQLNSAECSSIELVSTDSEDVGPPGEYVSIKGKETIASPSTSNEEEIEAPSPKQSKLLAIGTPISIRHSPFSALPSREKFAQSMGDIELFENLPNTTGTYQKLRSLLQKVKNVFKK